MKGWQCQDTCDKHKGPPAVLFGLSRARRPYPVVYRKGLRSTIKETCFRYIEPSGAQLDSPRVGTAPVSTARVFARLHSANIWGTLCSPARACKRIDAECAKLSRRRRIIMQVVNYACAEDVERNVGSTRQPPMHESCTNTGKIPIPKESLTCNKIHGCPDLTPNPEGPTRRRCVNQPTCATPRFRRLGR